MYSDLFCFLFSNTYVVYSCLNVFTVSRMKKCSIPQTVLVLEGFLLALESLFRHTRLRPLVQTSPAQPSTAQSRHTRLRPLVQPSPAQPSDGAHRLSPSMQPNPAMHFVWHLRRAFFWPLGNRAVLGKI